MVTTSEIYNKYIGQDIAVSFSWNTFIDKLGSARSNAARRTEREKYLFKGFKDDESDKIVLIECPNDVLPIEFEQTNTKKIKKEKNSIELISTKEERDGWINEGIKKCKELKLDCCVVDHNGKSKYLYLFNIKGLPVGHETAAKKEIVKRLLPSEALVFIDWTNIGPTLIPIIGRMHWKKTVKPDYKIHEIVSGKSPTEHKNDVSMLLKDFVVPVESSASHTQDEQIVKIKEKIKLIDLMKEYKYDLSRNPTMCLLGHESEGKSCFGYNKEKNIWHCLHCDAGGDVFNFIMDHEDVGFVEAKKILAKKAGVYIETVEEKKQKIVIKNNTNHLPHFDDLYLGLNLFGEKYNQIRKAMYYHCVGNAVKSKAIKINGIEFDTRINLSLLMRSGDGKNDIKQFLLLCTPDFMTRAEAVSLHSEQLVGKVVHSIAKETIDGVVEKIKKPKAVYGYLINDLLVMDECKKLFTSEELVHVEIRKFMCISLDVLTHNRITKQMVDFGNEGRLSYIAKCSIVLFSQPPDPINKEVLETGFTRRFFLASCIGVDNTKEIYRARTRKTDTSLNKQKFKDFLESLHALNDLTNFIVHDDKSLMDNDILSSDRYDLNWNMPNDVFEKVSYYAGLLYDLGRSIDEKSAHYTKVIYSQTLFDMLLKFACISAMYTRKEKNIIMEDLERAYMDLFELYYSTMDCIDQYTEDFYHSMKETDDLAILSWLRSQKATSNETSTITVKKLIEMIASLKEINLESAEKRTYKRLKKTELIGYKKVKEHEYVAWITDKGLSLLSNENIGIISPEFLEKYYEICNKFESERVQ